MVDHAKGQSQDYVTEAIIEHMSIGFIQTMIVFIIKLRKI